MNVDEFINAIFVRFPPSNISEYHTIEDTYGEYRNALTTNDEYDYEKALADVIANYEYKNAPSPYYLLGHLRNRVIKKTRRYVKFSSLWADKKGLSYEFGVEYSIEQTTRELKNMGFSNIRRYR